MRKISSEVIVIGPEPESRIIGHLIRANTNAKLTIAVAAKTTSSESRSILFGYPGHFDNFTRLVSAHGREFAEQIWQMSVHGLSLADHFLSSIGVDRHPMHKLRLLRTDHELREAREAVDWLKGLDCSEQIYNRESTLGQNEKLWRSDAFQRSKSDRSFWILNEKLQSCLSRTGSEVVYIDGAPDFRISRDEIGIYSDGAELSCEIIVVLGRNTAVSLFPALEDVLVRVKDQWVEFDRPTEMLDEDQFIIANHGNIWGATISDRMLLGGARYLQDLTSGNTGTDYVKHMQKLAGQLSPSLARMSNLQYFERSACYPCDELPVIGPHFSDHRVILVEGLWGWGINMLFAAGYGVAGLIAGQNFGLPRRLWPERLRSL